MNLFSSLSLVGSSKSRADVRESLVDEAAVSLAVAFGAAAAAAADNGVVVPVPPACLAVASALAVARKDDENEAEGELLARRRVCPSPLACELGMRGDGEGERGSSSASFVFEPSALSTLMTPGSAELMARGSRQL